MERRWYDKYPEAINTFELLKKMNDKTKVQISTDIINVSNQIKALRKEEAEQELSIGLDRVLGLYQSSQSRRWYDKEDDIGNAIKSMSTLPKEDYLNIMEGISVSFVD